MKQVHAGIIGLLTMGVCALPACASDMGRGGWEPSGYKDAIYPMAPWAGFYFGLNGGGGWSQQSDQLASPGVFNGLGLSGGFAGLQAGYNWQGRFGYDRLLLGIEADIQASAIEAKKGDGLGDAFTSRLEDFGTLRGRIGYTTDCTLLYFTGGLAYGSVKHEAVVFGGDFLSNTTSAGYVLGGGVEYKLTPAWSIKGEYQYINLGKNDPTDPALGSYRANGGIVRDDAFHTVRAGLNYQFRRDYEPLK
jgi:outer membrane immunogenic protein